jgi:predicted GTPase
MAFNTNLSISDLDDVLAAIEEVTRPHQLGIQLKIDITHLDEIDRNHPRDIDRQKIEVIKYWLRNSPDASWTTLANAVERMGGHAKLADRLLYTRTLTNMEFSPSASFPLDKCVPRSIILLGKMGHGTSTLGNRILNSDGYFKINNQRPQTTTGSVMIKSASQLKNYNIDIYDHTGLFEGASSIDELSSAVPEMLNLVIFVLKHGCDFDESEMEILRSLVGEWQISRISALVLTHCERLSEEERGEMIKQFKKDHPSITELMGKGILAIGFPDSS